VKLIAQHLEESGLASDFDFVEIVVDVKADNLPIIHYAPPSPIIIDHSFVGVRYQKRPKTFHHSVAEG
jgi:hypothetical protein